MEETGTTLREQLVEAMDAAEVETPVSAPQVDTETAAETAERIRDEKGRFAKSDGGGDDKAQLAADVEKRSASVGVQAEAATTRPADGRPTRPTSWKKEMWDHWEKLDPQVAHYIHERERNWKAGGDEALKGEVESLRPLAQAIAPFQPLLQQHGIQPGTWIQNLGNAHKSLALGSPQEKVQMFQRLAQDYRVPVALAVQGNDGQWQLLADQQQHAPQYQQQQQNFTAADVQRLVDEQFQAQATKQEVAAFAKSHPHYETVRSTMAGLLQSNVAEDLEGAYQKAIRLHDDIWQQEQKAKADADAAEKLAQTKQVAGRARANTTSVRTATPSGAMASAGGKKGLRDQIEEAIDSIGSSRV